MVKLIMMHMISILIFDDLICNIYMHNEMKYNS